MSNILFVFEGERTEDQITDSFVKHFFNNKIVVTCAFCAEIYQLHRALSEDEDLDTFALLKEIPQNEKSLKEFNRDDFAEIYLFFDYDGHSTLASDDSLEKMLAIFNEETNLGKLFISYPMVESVKHYSTKIDFKFLKVKAKENIKYKNIVSQEADKIYLQFSKYTFEMWLDLISIHLKKMNYVIFDNYIFPEENFEQAIIFEKQRKKFIEVDSTVSVLSGFPIFIYDYFGYKKFKENFLT